MCSDSSKSAEAEEKILELRNALTIVLGRAQLLRRHTSHDRLPTRQELEHALDVILVHGRRAADLLDSDHSSESTT
jgi:hypothetical protein